MVLKRQGELPHDQRGISATVLVVAIIWLGYGTERAGAQTPSTSSSSRHLAASASEDASSPSDALPSGGDADGTVDDPEGILNLDLEQLVKTDVVVPSMDIEVTSVAKQESTVGRSPAAIFVVTNEMIRRSGATSIPEALRMVPGMDVARIEANTWAVTCRGFKSRFANKLLVLIDGRTVYTPEFSGVYWDIQDLLLEDVERIEVIRGPGSTLWGANAVNGVINIITKTAKQTQGALITAGGGGVQDRAINGVRYGGQIGEGLYWRAYGKQFERGPGYDPAGAHDDWRMGRGGFRLDWQPDPCECNTLTVQGDYYGGREGHKMPFPNRDPPGTEVLIGNEHVSGANVLARWTHVVDDDSDWMLQSYFDRALRRGSVSFEQIDTFDVEWQHRFPLGQRQRIIWGLNFRQIHDSFRDDAFALSFDPLSRTMSLFGGFIQDEITLVEDRLSFTAGCKLEDHYFTGFNYQPSGRLLWTPDRKHSFWASVSRAVRTPSRFEHDGFATDPPFPDYSGGFPPTWIYLRWDGNPDVSNEELMAYEIGYRAEVSKRFAFDLAVFYNAYENLKTKRRGTPLFEWPDRLIIPFNLVNEMPGETYGVEVVGHWTMSDTWRFTAWYSFLQMELNELDVTPEYSEAGDSPHNQARLQSSWDLPRDWQFDLALRYVDNLPSVQQVPSYLSMDVRLAWVPSENFELALVGQNLLDDHHMEFNPYQYSIFPTQPRRSAFAKVTWRY